MTWIWITICAYFFGAVTVVLDKYLLSSEKIASPYLYAFYVGILGMGVLFFWPLGFFFPSFRLAVPSPHQFLLSISSGLLLMSAMTALYFAIKKSEASKVTPVVFSIVPVVTFFLAYAFGIEKYSYLKILGISLLIAGGLLISFDLPLKLKKKKFFRGFYFSILAGILMGSSLYILKLVYLEQNFFNGYFWTRFGAFLGAFLLLLVPVWRRSIIRSFDMPKKQKKESLHTGAIFIFNKILGGSSSALTSLAIGLGSVTIISSLISLQYVFVLILAVIFAKKLPHIFEERMYFWDWAQKVGAIFVIGIGMYFIS